MAKKKKKQEMGMAPAPVFLVPGTFEAVQSLSAKHGISIQEAATILCFNELRLIHSHLDVFTSVTIRPQPAVK